MEKIIDKLFNGDRVECEYLYETFTQKHSEQFDEAERTLRILLDALDEKQKKLFYAWRKAEDEITSDEVDAAYLRGFKTGAHFMIEIYDFKF